MAQFTITLTRAQLRAALIFAADKDIRYYINGVLLQVGECGDCRLIATDGHRLAVLDVGDHPGATPGEYIMPRDALKAVKRATRNGSKTVDLQIDGGRVMITDGGDIIAGGLLIDGKFPDWQRVCPEPSRMSGELGTFNAFYLADIGAALVELGEKFPALEMLHNGTSAGLVLNPEYGLMVAIMPMRGTGYVPTDSARAHFMPRRPVFAAVVETAAGGQAFPCDPAQDVSDKRREVMASGERAPREISNGYAARQEARRERFVALAVKMQGASAMHYSASRRAVEHIPFGQPILVGHHSERGHRATLARAASAMDKSCEAASKAAHYAQRAETVGSGGISSDDPAALVKLRAELAQCERLQEHMKATNKAIRAHKTPEARADALVALGMSETEAAQALKPDFMGRVGFPDYRLKNNGANARRIAARIAELERRRSADDVERAGNGYTYREDVNENRVMFEFAAKPAEAVRDILKNSGFRWSPTRAAWVRQLNNAGRWHAQDAARQIDALTLTSTDDAETPQAAEAVAMVPSGEAGEVQTPSEAADVPTSVEAETVPTSGEEKTGQASGEAVAAADACPTLIAGRWIPGGAENAERIAFDAALGAEVWLIPSRRRPGNLAVIAYSGKRSKHDAHYTMRDRAQALQWAGEYLGKLQGAARRQAERRAEQAVKRAVGHKLQAGDVLRCSWGYEQTNIDYYEVTRLIGKRMVEIRKIGAESIESGGMTGECVPRPGHYIGEPMRKTVSDYDGQSVRIASYASAHKIEPREVAGVKLYPVDHWSAYA